MTIYHKEKYKEISGYKGTEYSYQVVGSNGQVLKKGLSIKGANKIVKLTRIVHETDLKLQSFDLKIGDIN